MRDDRPIWHNEFSYTETRERTGTQHRMWAGELSDPADTIGIVVSTIRRDGPSTAEIAIPKQSIPHLIAFLQQQVDRGDDEPHTAGADVPPRHGE